MRQDSGYSNVTPEEFLDHEAIDYRPTSGSRGPQFNIKTCPLCGGSDWKVYLARDTGYGNCFHGSCGASFNLWTFAKAYHGTQDNTAVHRTFDEIAGVGGWRPKKRERIKRVITPAIQGALKLPNSVGISDVNIPYLKSRGIPPWVSRQFGLRMCINGAHKYKNEEGKDMSRSFSMRVLIPIYDLDGVMVTFQGRDVTGDQDPKYLFPSRLPSTARFIYNGQRAYAEKWSHAVMGEGAFDTIAIQMAIEEDRSLVGIGAVGSFGKKLTLDVDPEMETQLQSLIKLKHNGLHTITIMWDGEHSALSAAIKAAERLSKLGFAIRIAFLPKGKDPAEVSSDAVRYAIRTAIPFSRKLAIRIKLKNPYSK